MNKLLPVEDALEMVGSGTMLGIGGMTLYRRPVGFIKHLIRRFISNGHPADLTLMTFTAGFESDLLIGAGMIRRVRTCYFGLEAFGLAPMFTYFANRGEIEIIEETEASLSLGLRAQLAGVGFMPGKAWIGTDLLTLRPDVKLVQDPYRGDYYPAFPAIRPELSVIHAIKADFHGNAWIGDNKAIDLELAMASEKVIITAEEIVPELKKADIITTYVAGVVDMSNGAVPTSCHPLYPMDGISILEYASNVTEPQSFQEYLRAIL